VVSTARRSGRRTIDKVPAARPPEFGEHNDAISRASGYSDTGIVASRAAGTIADD
jgi:hypothetical protein